MLALSISDIQLKFENEDTKVIACGGCSRQIYQVTPDVIVKEIHTVNIDKTNIEMEIKRNIQFNSNEFLGSWHNENTYYLVFRKLECDLFDYFDAHPPTFDDIKEAMQSVEQLVGKIHARGSVHGDIKPSNIMVRNGKYYLIDLGSGSDSTVGYMPPQYVHESISIHWDRYGLLISFLTLLWGEWGLDGADNMDVDTANELGPNCEDNMDVDTANELGPNCDIGTWITDEPDIIRKARFTKALEPKLLRKYDERLTYIIEETERRFVPDTERTWFREVTTKWRGRRIIMTTNYAAFIRRVPRTLVKLKTTRTL